MTKPGNSSSGLSKDGSQSTSPETLTPGGPKIGLRTNDDRFYPSLMKDGAQVSSASLTGGNARASTFA